MNNEFIYPWIMIGAYEDDFLVGVGGSDEADCLKQLIDLQKEHGTIISYVGLTDEEYSDGEYVGFREVF